MDIPQHVECDTPDCIHWKDGGWLDALAHIPERLDGKVEPAVVFLRLAVVDPFPDPEVGLFSAHENAG